MSALQVAGLVLLSQVWAPVMIADLPSLRGLQVTSVNVKGPDGRLYDRFVGAENQPARQLVIKGTASGGRRWSIGIDLDAQVIGYADWETLTGEGHGGGSGELGIMLFGLPGILASLPLQIPWWALRALLQRLTRLTVHQQALFIKLRPQLPPEHQVPFLKALRNDNNGVAAEHWRRLDEERRRREDEEDG